MTNGGFCWNGDARILETIFIELVLLIKDRLEGMTTDIYTHTDMFRQQAFPS
jgi:hypothetical protein